MPVCGSEQDNDSKHNQDKSGGNGEKSLRNLNRSKERANWQNPMKKRNGSD